GAVADCTIIEATATVGGGALPLAELPGWVIAVAPRQLSLQKLSERLRQTDPPVLGRIKDDKWLLDPRTLIPGEESLLIAAFSKALNVEGKERQS
ncbi:MAG: hypothetical protein RQ722_07020, partial [Desulfuromonadales bacterium]|nr:hypothetical protein [Desulfuromonadales bacterium]